MCRQRGRLGAESSSASRAHPAPLCGDVAPRVRLRFKPVQAGLRTHNGRTSGDKRSQGTSLPHRCRHNRGDRSKRAGGKRPAESGRPAVRACVSSSSSLWAASALALRVLSSWAPCSSARRAACTSAAASTTVFSAAASRLSMLLFRARRLSSSSSRSSWRLWKTSGRACGEVTMCSRTVRRCGAAGGSEGRPSAALELPDSPGQPLVVVVQLPRLRDLEAQLCRQLLVSRLRAPSTQHRARPERKVSLAHGTSREPRFPHADQRCTELHIALDGWAVRAF